MINCNICRVELIRGENWRESTAAQKHYRCLKCISSNRKKYYLENRDQLLKDRRIYYSNNLENHIFSRCKKRAKDQGIEFNLDLEDIKIPEICPVFKVKFIHRDSALSPSLDRIDPSKGYIKGNVQVISNLANTMKQNATKEQLILFSEWVDRMFVSRYND